MNLHTRACVRTSRR